MSFATDDLREDILRDIFCEVKLDLNSHIFHNGFPFGWNVFDPDYQRKQQINYKALHPDVLKERDRKRQKIKRDALKASNPALLSMIEKEKRLKRKAKCENQKLAR